MTTRVERFVDTNVLLEATTPARPRHAAALATLEAGFEDRSLFLSGQVLREYVAVATRPSVANGLGLAPTAALTNARQFRERANFLPEDAEVSAALFSLLVAVPCLGRQVHDANLAATMIVHRIHVLITLNPSDFVRFGDRIQVVGLPMA